MSKSMSSKVVIAGLALFSMVFGAGNIGFPLIIGKDFMSSYQYSIFGWLLATVVIPISGYFGAMLFDGDNKKYLAPLGRHATFVLMFIIMMIAGPFGVIARGVNFSFGGFHVLLPSLPEYVFNLIYCLITILLAWFPGKIVQIIGVVFTPLKFGGVALVTVAALYFGGSFSDIPDPNIAVSTVVSESFKVGYQTMDLLAAFLMASTVFVYLKNSLPEEKRNDPKQILKFSGLVCLVGAFVLSIVYIGLILIGAQYSASLQGTPNESLFPKIAELAMGGAASWFVAIVVAACVLATNIALSSVFTDFVHKDILKERFNRKVILVLVGGLTFVMSLLGFDKICSILGLLLGPIYPALIVFTVARLAYYFARIHNR